MVAVTVFVIIGMAVVQIIANTYGEKLIIGEVSRMARSSEHQRVQREGKKRDYGTCCVCGSKERPEGHHVIEYQYGGAATLDNIVTLCQKCHKQVHRGNIDIMKF